MSTLPRTGVVTDGFAVALFGAATLAALGALAGASLPTRSVAIPTSPEAEALAPDASEVATPR